MFILSHKTRKVKETLEGIKLNEVSGKELLKNFLDCERKKLFNKSVDTIIKESKNEDSNIKKFAKLLADGNNIKLFKKAIELQAKSLGTKEEKSLFYTLVYNKNISWNKSKIKAFLLAKEDKKSIIEDEDVTDYNDKNSHRMKNADIVEKLKSNRLSNVLKVFIALVIWNYINVNKSSDGETQTNRKTDEAEHKFLGTNGEKCQEEEAAEEERKRKKEEEHKQHEAERTETEEEIRKRVQALEKKCYEERWHAKLEETEKLENEILETNEKATKMFMEREKISAEDLQKEVKELKSGTKLSAMQALAKFKSMKDALSYFILVECYENYLLGDQKIIFWIPKQLMR